tara:strand:+ start:351 stop:569 length:219 start_codon:yes stop_codon:yes gene_type:complete
MTYEEQKFKIRTDPSASYWLKAALEALDKRDPVDAYNDAQALAGAQKRREIEIRESNWIKDPVYGNVIDSKS